MFAAARWSAGPDRFHDLQVAAGGLGLHANRLDFAQEVRSGSRVKLGHGFHGDIGEVFLYVVGSFAEEDLNQGLAGGLGAAVD